VQLTTSQFADRVVTAAISEPRSAWWRGSTQRQVGASWLGAEARPRHRDEVGLRGIGVTGQGRGFEPELDEVLSKTGVAARWCSSPW